MSATVLRQFKFHKKGQKTQVTGWLWSDLVFRKNVTPHEHQLETPRAWCLDAATLDELCRIHSKTPISIHLYDTKNEVTWIISPSYFLEHSGELDRGYGKQYYCPLKWWQSISKNAWIPVKTPETKQPKLKGWKEG